MQLVYMVVWLVAGVVMIVYSLATGRPLIFTGTGIPMWTVCFGFALFNLARWYASRMGAADRQAASIAEEARKRQARQRRGEREYDPNFDFNRPSDEPKP